MSADSRPAWERYGDRMVDVAGYALLAIATILGVLGGPRDATDRRTRPGG